MANALFREHFQEKIRHAVEQARTAQKVEHRGIAGQVRELLVSEILRPALPPTVEIATNVVMVDHVGGQSPEVDVVVFDRTSLPPLLYGDNAKFVPVDACIYAIEVKTCLTATTIKDALRNADRIASLEYVSELMAHGRPHSRVVTALFGFDSDLLGKTPADEVQRVTRYRSKLRYPEIARIEGRWHKIEAPGLKVLCVPGRCYAYHGVTRDPRTGSLGDYMWQLWPTNGDAFDEVIAFVGGLANTVAAEVAGRRTLSFGDYLITAN